MTIEEDKNENDNDRQVSN